jgi:hypothetical protein
MATRKQYTKEFKQDEVRLVTQQLQTYRGGKEPWN